MAAGHRNLEVHLGGPGESAYPARKGAVQPGVEAALFPPLINHRPSGWFGTAAFDAFPSCRWPCSMVGVWSSASC